MEDQNRTNQNLDTTNDSWDSGDNKPDLFDRTKYSGEADDKTKQEKPFVVNSDQPISHKAPSNANADDTGDDITSDANDDLGITENSYDDLVGNLGAGFDNLDDSEWRDDSFDCD